MSRGERPDKDSLRKGGNPWNYRPIPCGTSEGGWKAGPPLGVYTHWVGVTKPCKRRITKGALLCHHCEGKMVPVWRGATPWYDREYQCAWVWITEEYDEATCEIAHLAPIRLSRGRNKRDPVVIRQEEKCLKVLPHNPKRVPEIDLWETLLLAWKDSELVGWSRANQATPAAPAALPTIRPVPPKKKAQAEALANRVGDLLHVRDGDNLRPVGDMFPNLAKAAANGNGKH